MAQPDNGTRGRSAATQPDLGANQKGEREKEYPSLPVLIREARKVVVDKDTLVSAAAAFASWCAGSSVKAAKASTSELGLSATPTRLGSSLRGESLESGASDDAA